MKKKDTMPWMSIADIMSGLMIVFMFISIVFMVQVQKQQERTNEMIEQYAVVKQEIYDDLYEEFKDDLPHWNAELDKETLAVKFQEPDVLFGKGSATLTPQFMAVLNDFLPRYIKVLSQDKYRDEIEEIRIEGHTDPYWAGARTRREEYLNNMDLSQQRTRAVLSYAINMPALNSQLEWMISKLTANGLSSSQPVYYDDGHTINEAASRNVEFRVRTNADEKMNELNQEGR